MSKKFVKNQLYISTVNGLVIRCTETVYITDTEKSTGLLKGIVVGTGKNDSSKLGEYKNSWRTSNFVLYNKKDKTNILNNKYA